MTYFTVSDNFADYCDHTRHLFIGNDNVDGNNQKIRSVHV